MREQGWQSVRVRAPHLVGDGEAWLNMVAPRTIADLTARGPLLVEFWEYSCVNCLRTLPYLATWHDRYAPLGLELLGIHTPEFAFGREREQVARAVERLDLPYPILLDNALHNWHAFANRAWPTRYLIDRERVIRYRWQGEGAYQQTEQAIQTLLREQHGAGLALPEPLPPLRPADAPGVVCFPATPELHAGYAHGRLGNPGDFGLDGTCDFAPVPAAAREAGRLYFEGKWHGAQEYSEAASAESSLHVPYRAVEVNAVLASADGSPQRLFLRLDGQPLAFDEMGEDVVVDSELGSYVTVSTPRMYSLVITPAFASRTLTLDAQGPGLRVYAFSFVSCPTS